MGIFGDSIDDDCECGWFDGAICPECIDPALIETAKESG